MTHRAQHVNGALHSAELCLLAWFQVQGAVMLSHANCSAMESWLARPRGWFCTYTDDNESDQTRGTYNYILSWATSRRSADWNHS